MRKPQDLHGDELARYWSLILQYKFADKLYKNNSAFLRETTHEDEIKRELLDKINAILSKE